MDRPLLHVAGAQVVGGAAVVAFLRAHRTTRGPRFLVRRDGGRFSVEANAGRGGLDLLERPAVLVAGLEVEGVHLTGAAAHPQENARPLPAWVRRRSRGEGAEPARERGARQPRGCRLQPATA